MNPFIKDCYLVKYDQSPAAIITSREFFQKNARKASDCKGWNFGIILQKSDGEIRYSKGLVLSGETLVGGWFKAQPEGWHDPFELEVNLSGYLKKKGDGSLTQFWAPEKQATMIAKVAEVQGLRALWGEESSGMYTVDEIPEAQALDFSKTEGGAYEVETESASIALRAAFDGAMLASGLDPDPLFDQWMEVCAKSNEITIEKVKAEAMKDIDGFKNGFATWKKAQKKQPEKPADTWGIFRKKWINLKSGFEQFMWEEKNQELFKLAEAEDPDLYNEGRNKYISQIGKAWPLDPKTEDTGKGEGDDAEASGADEGKDKGGEKKDDSKPSQDVYQSKEWQELSMLKEKHPDEYVVVVNDPRVVKYLDNPKNPYSDKIDWIKEAIARIDAKVDKNGSAMQGYGEVESGGGQGDEGGIPDGDEKF